ncbi:hypothetical protein PENTCL1PPCAC_11932 [Pristionchus entomophagus]|uniref:Uncharacterized protein n=1 Tax=Pristionchus entomophagus TaxID=358040 RepID=A0AAV5T2E9_9BILA|nr:hypothetical protein PENTCL1PPCAC_11932 [Pristionchus entomophagus]
MQWKRYWALVDERTGGQRKRRKMDGPPNGKYAREKMKQAIPKKKRRREEVVEEVDSEEAEEYEAALDQLAFQLAQPKQLNKDVELEERRWQIARREERRTLEILQSMDALVISSSMSLIFSREMRMGRRLRGRKRIGREQRALLTMEKRGREWQIKR